MTKLKAKTRPVPLVPNKITCDINAHSVVVMTEVYTLGQDNRITDSMHILKHNDSNSYISGRGIKILTVNQIKTKTIILIS